MISCGMNTATGISNWPKVRLNPENKEAVSPLPVLVNVLETALRLLHPFMPFVTEELWQNLRSRLPAEWQKTESIMVAKYPKADNDAVDTAAENIIEAVIDITRAIRNIRAENKVESTKWIAAEIYSGKLTADITPHSAAIQSLAKVKPLEFKDGRLTDAQGEKFAVAVLKEADVIVPMASMIDLAVEREKILKEIAQIDADVARLEIRLKDEAFLSKAPAPVVAKRERTADRKERARRQTKAADRVITNIYRRKPVSSRAVSIEFKSLDAGVTYQWVTSVESNILVKFS